jgi:hypothetical protein
VLQLDQRGVADRLDDVVVDFHACWFLLEVRPSELNQKFNEFDVDRFKKEPPQ